MASIGRERASLHKPRRSYKARRSRADIWKVIAPFITAPKKVVDVEDEQFSFYLQKKPTVLIRDLSRFMSDSVDLPSLFIETSEALKKVVRAAWVCLYMVDQITNNIYYSCQQENRERFRVNININTTETVACYVARHKQYVLVDDIVTEDKKFPEGLGYDHESLAKSVMCIPVLTPEGEIFAIFEFVRLAHEPPFNDEDLKICVMVTAWMGVAIHQNQERLALKRQQELNDYLLDLITCFLEDNVLMEKLMCEVIKFAKITLGAERGSFFLVEQESNEMVAYLFDEEESADDMAKIKKLRLPKDRGIAGLVVETGETVNIKDAYRDSRFNKEFDQSTGFITRSILCMPILGARGVLGVVQVVNKKNAGCFTHWDEILFKTFSLYCSLAMHYTNVHREINKQKFVNNQNLNIVKLHQKPCIHDYEFYQKTKHCTIPIKFDSFSWYINNDELPLAPRYTVHMFTKLIPPSEINMEDLVNFILTIRKFYQDIPYHNFEHAFNVCHCMYLILKRNMEKFSKLEVKALLVACIGHDLDHPGYTNSFLILVQHDLSHLYESSILENHHYQMMMRVLSSYEIYKDFDEADKKNFHDEIYRAILSTDLAHYFQNKANIVRLVKSKRLNWEDQAHRTHIKAIMMNCCDLSGCCKPFLPAKRITDNLYREFYNQGDLEKEMGLCPLSIMNRDEEDCVPEDQIRFISVLVLPCLDILREMFPNTYELFNGACILRSTWQDIILMRGQKIWRQDDSIVKEHL